MRAVAFLNNRNSLEKSALVYHLAHLFAEEGVRVLAADLDPQANLSSMFIDDEHMARLWEAPRPATIYQALEPLLEGTGDVVTPEVERIAPNLGLVVGDLTLSRAEDELSSEWARCLDGKTRAFRMISAFWRVLEQAALQMEANLVLIDVGPNLGAINRAALIAANHVVIPLAPDLFSLQGLKNLGPTLRTWRAAWQQRLKVGHESMSLPPGDITPLGYVVMQHGVRESRPVAAYQEWIKRIPRTYREAVLDERVTAPLPAPPQDPHCLAMLKHYRSLMPLAMEAHKPMFHLKPADGAIGAHLAAVRDCHRDFHQLAQRIGSSLGIDL